MLVLSRKRNESIVINDNIKITVVDIRGDKVRLGITAPRDIPVHREEVYEAIYGRPCQIPLHNSSAQASAAQEGNDGPTSAEEESCEGREEPQETA